MTPNDHDGLAHIHVVSRTTGDSNGPNEFHGNGVCPVTNQSVGQCGRADRDSSEAHEPLVRAAGGHEGSHGRTRQRVPQVNGHAWPISPDDQRQERLASLCVEDRSQEGHGRSSSRLRGLPEEAGAKEDSSGVDSRRHGKDSFRLWITDWPLQEQRHISCGLLDLNHSVPVRHRIAFGSRPLCQDVGHRPIELPCPAASRGSQNGRGAVGLHQPTDSRSDRQACDSGSGVRVALVAEPQGALDLSEEDPQGSWSAFGQAINVPQVPQNECHMDGGKRIIGHGTAGAWSHVTEDDAEFVHRPHSLQTEAIVGHSSATCHNKFRAAYCALKSMLHGVMNCASSTHANVRQKAIDLNSQLAIVVRV